MPKPEPICEGTLLDAVILGLMVGSCIAGIVAMWEVMA